MLRKIGIIVSISLAVILSASAICETILLIWPEADSDFISLISDNWLLVIFKIHARLIDISVNPLKGLNLYDIIILALFSITCLSTSFALKMKNKIWYIVSVSLPLIGILLFIITQLAGRSSLMGSGMIISIILLSKRSSYKLTGLAGILANGLLLTGDLTVGINSGIITALFGVGYTLLIVWFFMIARILVLFER